MLSALERVTLAATRALSVIGLVALMGLATMTLADGLARWIANRPMLLAHDDVEARARQSFSGVQACRSPADDEDVNRSVRHRSRSL